MYISQLMGMAFLKMKSQNQVTSDRFHKGIESQVVEYSNKSGL